jgi:hypothetical protein
VAQATATSALSSRFASLVVFRLAVWDARPARIVMSQDHPEGVKRHDKTVLTALRLQRDKQELPSVPYYV